MPGTPMLQTLQTYLQHGLHRCLRTHDEGSQPTDFAAYVAGPETECHSALELQEVLHQVFRHLDPTTLCSSVPLVCQQWRVAASSDHLWTYRLDPDLLSVAAVQHRTATVQQHASPSTGLPPTNQRSSNLDTRSDSAPAETAGSNNAAASNLISSAVSTHLPPVRLPLLYHAVYGGNLLRNPLFLAALNADYSQALRWRPSGSSSAGPWKAPAVLTAAQRKHAWVATVGAPSWQQPCASTADAQLPLPLRYTGPPPSSSSPSRLQAQLHGWLFGRQGAQAESGTGAAAAAAAAATAPCRCPGNSSGTSARSGQHDATSNSTRAACSSSASGRCVGGSSVCQGAAQGAAGNCSYLETGSDWAEVVQVVDLLSELTARGLDPSTAAAVLDEAGLAMALSFWVAAAPSNPPGPVEAAAAATPLGSQATAAASSSVQPAGHAASGGGGGAAAAAANRRPPAQFAAALMLDNGQVSLASFQTFVISDSSHHFFSKRLAVHPADGWKRYAYVVPACPKGVRRAVVLLRGRGGGGGDSSSSSSGSAVDVHVASGVRFACAQLCFLRRDEVAGFGAAACLEGWQERVVQGHPHSH